MGAPWCRAATAAAPISVAAILPFATPAFAETSTISAADTAWMIVATALVLMMTVPGLALFYSGMVRKKNVLATMAQSLATVATISILWVAFGYSLAFVGDGPWLGTLDRWFLAGMTMDGVNPAAKTIPECLFMLYQMTFAIITVALVAGSVADRMRFSAYLLFSIGWFMFVYVPLAHWVWGGGFLGTMGVLDFAGGLVVHLSAGVGGLVAAKVMGRRHGYGTENLSPFDLSLAVMGTGLLWVGWFGFNGGSALGANSRGDGDHRHPSGGLCRRADLGRDRMDDPAQAVGARHDFRRGRGPRNHHPGLGIRRAMARHRHWGDRGPGVLLGLHLAEAPLQLRRFPRCVRRPRYRRNDRNPAGRGIRDRLDRRNFRPDRG
jgi:Ammonium Transporter Family